MKVKLMALACGLIAPLAFAQTTTVTRETTTVQEIARLDSTHVMTVKGFAPGENISIQTSPDTNPVTIRLDHAIAYTDGDGQPISPSSIQPGSHVRLEFVGTGPDRMVSRIVMVNPK